MRVAVFATCPPATFSGGRYHALMAAAVLARRGHDAWFVTDNAPVFAPDLAAVAPDRPVRIVVDKSFRVAPLGRFDWVLVAPQMGRRPEVYRNAIRFARDAGARLSLINYESPNWFNAYAPEPRDPANWSDWLLIAEHGALVLCSAEESRRYAREFYAGRHPDLALAVWSPAINSVAMAAARAALEAEGADRARRIVVFARPGQNHKGIDALPALCDPALKGYALAPITGGAKGAEALLDRLRPLAERAGITLEPHGALTDHEKFRLIRASAAVVFPSAFEGYGYPPIEALACDTPCVAFDLPVLRETCGDRIRYAPQGDTAALRARLLEALAEGPQRVSDCPEVVERADVDRRAAALEATLRAHAPAQAAETPGAVALGDAALLPLHDGVAAVFVVVAPAAISADPEGPRAHPLAAGPDGARAALVLPLSADSPAAALRAARPIIRIGGRRVVLDLSAIRLAPTPARLRAAAAATDLIAAPSGALLSGRLATARRHDALLLLDRKGQSAGLEGGLTVPAQRGRRLPRLRRDTGFVSDLFPGENLALDSLSVVLLRDGRAVAAAECAPPPDRRRPAVTAGAADDPAPASEADYPTPAPREITASPGRVAGFRRARNAPRAIVTALRTAGTLAHAAARSGGAVARRAMRRGGSVDLAVSEWRCEPGGEGLLIRGWVSRPEACALRLRNLAQGQDLDVPLTRQPRADVAEKLGRAEARDIGFTFHDPDFAGDPGTLAVQAVVGGVVLREAQLSHRAPALGARILTAVAGCGPTVAIDDWAFDFAERRLDIRGWIERAPAARVEIWNLARGRSVAETVANLPRPDLAGRAATGFAFSVAVAWTDGEALSLKVSTVGGRERWTALLDPSAAAEAEVTAPDRAYDPRSGALWARGRARAAMRRPEKVRARLDGVLIAETPLGPVRLIEGRAEATWRIETRLATPPPKGARLRVEAVFADGTVAETETGLPVEPSNRGWSAAEARAVAEAAGARPEIAFRGAAPNPETPAILLVAHNLHAPERPEKRRALEELRAALNAQGRELVILHHGKGASGCALPEIAWDDPTLVASAARLGADDALSGADRAYCERLLYGFHAAINRRPDPIERVRETVREQERRLRAVFLALGPEAALLWHQWNSLMTLARRAAETAGAPSAYVHEGMLPGTMTIDPAGMMAEAGCVGLVAPDAETPGRAAARRAIAAIAEQGLDRKPQTAAPAAEALIARLRAEGRRVVFYAGSNDWQSGVLPRDHPRAALHAPHFHDSIEALRALTSAAERQGAAVVFKPHPNLFPEPSGLVSDALFELREGRTIDYVRAADATATLVSSVAYIALACGKPTLLMGRNTLSGAGAAREIASRGDLDAALADALADRDGAARRARFERHVAALLAEHLFPYGGKTDFALLGYDDAARRILALTKTR